MATYFFGFGSNMNLDALRLKGLSPSYAAAARLDDWALFFGGNLGMARVCPEEGATVYGVLFRVTEEEAATLRRKEAGDVVYTRAQVEVQELLSGERRSVEIFSSPEGKEAVQQALPSERYIAILVAGARSFELPREYVHHLASHPCVPEPEVYREFVRDGEVPIMTEIPNEIGSDGSLCFGFAGEVVRGVPNSAVSHKLFEHFKGKDLTAMMGTVFLHPSIPAGTPLYSKFLQHMISDSFEAPGLRVVGRLVKKSAI